VHSALPLWEILALEYIPRALNKTSILILSVVPLAIIKEYIREIGVFVRQGRYKEIIVWVLCDCIKEPHHIRMRIARQKAFEVGMPPIWDPLPDAARQKADGCFGHLLSLVYGKEPIFCGWLIVFKPRECHPAAIGQPHPRRRGTILGLNNLGRAYTAKHVADLRWGHDIIIVVASYDTLNAWIFQEQLQDLLS